MHDARIARRIELRDGVVTGELGIIERVKGLSARLQPHLLVRGSRASQFQPATMTLISMPRLGLLALGCALLIAIWPAEAFKKKKEDETQTLQVPKDPPAPSPLKHRGWSSTSRRFPPRACSRSRCATR